MRVPVLGGPITSRVGGDAVRRDSGEFADLVRGAAQHLAERGAGAGDHLAVDVEDPVDQLAWLLGADVAGAATLVVEPSWSDRERRTVLDDARPARILDHSPEPRGGTSAPDAGMSGDAGKSAGGPHPAGDGGTRFYLPTTSGSTGRPRVLARNRRSWLDSYAAFDLGLRSREAVLVPGPLSSSLFLFAALHALHGGHDLELLHRWSAAEAAEKCRRSAVIHVVPAMLSALLAVWEREPALREQCALTAIVCGGARLDDAVRQRAHRVLPECRIVEYYGAAEHSLIAIDRDGSGLRPVVDVDVRDEHGESAPAGRAGELWTRSGLVFDGYLEGGALDRPPPSRGAEWLSVGDRATHHADGTLAVHGRSSATIASGGTVVSAEEVEAALRGAEGVLDVLACPTPHERFGEIVTAVLETRCGSPSAGELRALARAELEPAKRPRRWLWTAELPRTAAGKPARALVAERLRAGTLDARAVDNGAVDNGALDGDASHGGTPP